MGFFFSSAFKNGDRASSVRKGCYICHILRLGLCRTTDKKSELSILVLIYYCDLKKYSPVVVDVLERAEFNVLTSIKKNCNARGKIDEMDIMYLYIKLTDR